MKYSAIILCAGSGKRTGLDYNKMFYKIGGQTVYEKTINVFLGDNDCRQLIVVCKEEEKQAFTEIKSDDRLCFVEGGKERQDSVYQGLRYVNQEYVMIHDGARCFLKMDLLERIKDCLQEHDACLALVPSIDTVKRVINGKVIETLKRSELYNAQTPQAFRTELIKLAYQNAIEDQIPMTDDASAVELLGKDVHMVLGDYTNKKITTKEDVSQ